MQQVCSIYTLIDPRDGAVRYVGKSVDPEPRYKAHCAPSNRCGTRKWIQELRMSGLMPIMQIVEEIIGTDAGLWSAREQYWIGFYCDEEEPLLNLNVNNSTLQGWLYQKRLESRERKPLDAGRYRETTRGQT